MSDTVGYWYVEQLRDGHSRLYYSIDSSLPSWIPSAARDALLRIAAKRATGWVDAECRRVVAARDVHPPSPLQRAREAIRARIA
jgi:hypothetical protein